MKEIKLDKNMIDHMQQLNQLNPINNITQQYQDNFKKNMATIEKSKKEKEMQEKERHEEQIKLLTELVTEAKEKPKFANQVIHTLIKDSEVHNMQNNYDNSKGIQNITNNTGLNNEEYIKLFENMKELFELLPEDKTKETEEIIEQLDTEIKKPNVKKGIVKACVAFLTTQANDIIKPGIGLIKEQFIDFATGKSQIVAEGLKKLLENLS